MVKPTVNPNLSYLIWSYFETYSRCSVWSHRMVK